MSEPDICDRERIIRRKIKIIIFYTEIRQVKHSMLRFGTPEQFYGSGSFYFYFRLPDPAL